MNCARAAFGFIRRKVFASACLALSLALVSLAYAQTTVTLQQGLNGYGGTTDDKIACCSFATANYGSDTFYSVIADTSTSVLIRFAIFQSEGGPVPNGSTITSATLSFYKYWGPQTGDSTFKAVRLLKNWKEMQATWNQAASGVSWQVAGAFGSADIAASPDGQATVSTDINQWLNIDVTPGVQAFAGGTPNYGWKIAYVSGGDSSKPKEFYARNNSTLQPKLTITYSASGGTTATLQQGLGGYTGTADAKYACCSFADTNFGSDTTYSLITDTSTALLVRFNNIFQSQGGPVPDGATINSATLSFYKFGGPASTFKANQVLKNWSESAVTWNNTGAGQAWSTPGVFSGDINSTPDGTASIGDAAADGCQVSSNWPAACWLNLDVTASVRAFASGTANYGWKISDTSGASGTPREFNSRENTSWPTLLPKLTINYNGGITCTLPTAQFTDSPGSANLSVNFDATTSADGNPPPITNLTLDFGDGSTPATWPTKTQVQSHTYTTAGTKNVTLTVANACGSSAPLTRSITVTSGTPIPRFTATQAPASWDVTFNAATSSDGSAAITRLELDFDDSTTHAVWSDKSQPKVHTYATAGTKHVTLWTTNSYGTTSLQQNVQVTDPTNTACVEPTELVASGQAVPTFHSMSIYYDSGSFNGDSIYLRYRKGSDNPDDPASWKTGHPLWNDGNAPTLRPYHGRGSVVHLDPGTQYVFEVSTDNSTWKYIPGMTGEKCPATWPETANLPVSPDTPPGLWSGTQQPALTTSLYLGEKGAEGLRRSHVLLANHSGTADGYTVYNLTGATATTTNDSNVFPVVISGSYIILRGLKTVGGESGVYIDPGSHHIVIEEMEITNYGRDHGESLGAGLTGEQGYDEDAGIKFPESRFGPILDTKQIVIQRNKIHNPAFGTHPWDSGSHPNGAHPYGPTPIMMYPTGGQIVIRYNEAYSTLPDPVTGERKYDGAPDFNHFHQDGLVMGGCNALPGNCADAIGIGPDVDIYKNLVMHYFDDGLETDGDGINNRVWKNYFDYGGASAVSTTPTRFGPVYAWRNVYNRARMWYSESWGNEHERLYMFKSGSIGFTNGGRRYIYHNTALQPSVASQGAPGPNTLGAGFGAGGNGIDRDTGADQNMQNTVTRNNVFANWYSAPSGISSEGALQEYDGVNDFDYDLTNGGLSEANGYANTVPQYQAGNGWSAWWTGKYRLAPGTSGYHDGWPIPNFSDGYTGARPDRGAHEDATPDMKFGPDAYGSGS
jgi:PKD repeat protein